MSDDILVPRRLLQELLDSLNDSIDKLDSLSQKRLEFGMTRARLQSILDITDPDKTPRAISTASLKINLKKPRSSDE
jgi:hypothetical protein